MEQNWISKTVDYTNVMEMQKQPPELLYEKKVFLEISQNSQEITCAKVSFLIKLQASDLQLYQKRDSGTVVFLWALRNF